MREKEREREWKESERDIEKERDRGREIELTTPISNHQPPLFANFKSGQMRIDFPAQVLTR